MSDSAEYDSDSEEDPIPLNADIKEPAPTIKNNNENLPRQVRNCRQDPNISNYSSSRFEKNYHQEEFVASLNRGTKPTQECTPTNFTQGFRGSGGPAFQGSQNGHKSSVSSTPRQGNNAFNRQQAFETLPPDIDPQTGFKAYLPAINPDVRPKLVHPPSHPIKYNDGGRKSNRGPPHPGFQNHPPQNQPIYSDKRPMGDKDSFRSRDQQENQDIKYVGYKKLEEWSVAPNSTVLVFEISLHVDGLKKLLANDRLKPDWIKLLILALKNVLSAQSQKHSLQYIMQCVCHSRFFDFHLSNFLQELKRKPNDPALISTLHYICDIVEYVVMNMKTYMAKCDQCLYNIQKSNILGEDSGISQRTQVLRSHCSKSQLSLPPVARDEEVAEEESYNDQRPRRQKRPRAIPAPDTAEPPDHYSHMHIFPDTEELFASVEPFLRANKTSGAYRDLSHYLDIHSRLLKEDYLAPIRTGIKNFKVALENDTKPNEDDLRFYYNVKLAKMKCDEDNGITHFVVFDRSELGYIDWEFSRRLMFGSLLVFSSDNFETTIFATVANRDSDKLERGVVEVIFHNNLEKVFTASENEEFIMAETTAYFESYRHVLEGLQEMDDIPMQKYIVSCSPELSPPRYVQDHPNYDLTPIMYHENGDHIFPVLNFPRWPNRLETKLNDTQLEALKLALTNELAVIQGPPGTGKTFIGLKIMQILLDNEVLKQNTVFFKNTQNKPKGPTSSPILVVCYTNHALDQFLEGMLDFCEDGIVRVGGRSSSELLSQFNLKELRQKADISKKTRMSRGRNLRICREQLKEVSKIIDVCWQELLRLETTILDADDLVEEMNEKHKNSLLERRRIIDINTNPMNTWLKANNVNMDSHLSKACARHLSKVIASRSEESFDVLVKSERNLSVENRVKVYHFWLNKHKGALELEVEKLLSDGNGESVRLEELMQDLDKAAQDILPDDILTPYMSEGVYDTVKQRVERENAKVDDTENTYIRSWLVGRFSRTDEFLDVIERLTSKAQPSKSQQSRGRGGIMADTEVSVYEDKWVIDDSDTSDSDEDDEDHSSVNSEMDDIDDGGEIKMEDIRDIAENYKQFKNKEVRMLQRARMLGVDMSGKKDEEEEEWKTVNTMTYSKVFRLYNVCEAMTEEEVEDVDDLWSLQLKDRYRLYKYWVLQKKAKLSYRLIDLTEEYRAISKRKKEALSLRDIEILENARVIGMTTTGAAKHRAVLQAVGCRIIVVEEAAEVLEAHIVTTLNRKCEHLILIGDHQQLRPSPNVHQLAVDYDLEISLFERLVKNNIPRVTLDEQHRMRPEISTFVRFIYPALLDHESVMDYDDIRGVTSNVYFLNHSYEESAVEDSHSKCNVHEAEFLTGLCKYFMQHGYLPRQITVLAAYGGQVKCIRTQMEPEPQLFEHVRVTSIDNYQGEENDIMLLSLVRSNRDHDVGFLKVSNRVCVALSRAKKGLFVIGNLNQLALKSALWTEVLRTARENHVTGTTLKLVCINHSQHVTHVCNGEDFAKNAPEGGCNRMCDALLHCGHTCRRMCHASDRLHEEYKCELPCRQICPEGHPCQKNCYEPCGVCEVQVSKVIPTCGHTDLVPCYKDVEDVQCSQTCNELLLCGHRCRGQCGVCSQNEDHQPCLEKVDKKWPCDHTNSVVCWKDTDDEPCPAKCKEKLECGHKCKGTCGGCLSGRVHAACQEKACKKELPCGHPCKGPCGVLCPPCEFRCPTECRHGPCTKKTCGELCIPCTENCALVCRHKKCSLLCKDECSELPCSKSCEKNAQCGHKCYSLCGEICVCFDCEKEKFSLIDSSTKSKPKYVVAHEKRERANKFEVTKETVLMKVPKCGHIFTIKQLDRYMEEAPSSSTFFYRCPNCTAPIQNILRYDRKLKTCAERREDMKEKVINRMKVPAHKIESLKESKALVESFCNVDEGEFLANKSDQIDSNHALALTLQIRFAYALKKIQEIHSTLNREDFKVSKWKHAIERIGRHMPAQLEREMLLELTKLVLLEQAVVLFRLIKDSEISIADNIKNAYRQMIKDGKQKMTAEQVPKFQATVNALYKQFDGRDPESFRVKKTVDLRSQSQHVMNVLKQPNDQDLAIILDD